MKNTKQYFLIQLMGPKILFLAFQFGAYQYVGLKKINIMTH